jgi:phosphohistidine swiveling domain-containing protein
MAEVSFDTPGPGTWEMDATHFGKPLSLYAAAIVTEPLQRGFMEGTERYGLLYSHPVAAIINGFYYSKGVLAFVPEDAPPGPPPEGFFDRPEVVARIETGVKAIENKLWREDLKNWDEKVKPDSIRRHQKFQAVDIVQLDTEALIEHLVDCFENVKLMWYRHHIFTVASVMPVGLYLAKVCEWTDVVPAEALGLLKGSSPVSLGIAYDELLRIAQLLKQAGFEPDQHRARSAATVLQLLRSMPEPIGPLVEEYLDIVGYQLTSGYDILEQFALETPQVLIAGIFRVLTNLDKPDTHQTEERQRVAIRDRVPAEHRTEFDSLLHEARYINRLRDERGVYNEGKAFGLARRAVLEAGRRLHAEGRLHDALAMVHASHDEMLAMLRGEVGPGEAELKQRQDWFRSKTCDDVPPFLGPEPEPPPPLDAVPEAARRGQAAIGAAMGNVYDVPPVESESAGKLEGISVSPGIYEGIARLIQNPTDFHRLQLGDVLISKCTSSSFNVVMPLLGALVTDRGGLLSHAAIVAREYGIPGIVGTRKATSVIVDGSRVRVDGAAGTVEVLS